MSETCTDDEDARPAHEDEKTECIPAYAGQEAVG